MPHITRPLWTPEKCRFLLQQSGFADIQIEIDRTRRFKNDDFAMAWRGQNFYPRGNPLENLSDAQRELLLSQSQKAIAPKLVRNDVWQDSTTLYVQAGK